MTLKSFFQLWPRLIVLGLFLASLGVVVHQSAIYFRYYGPKQAFGIQENLYPSEIPSVDFTEKDLTYIFGADNREFTDQDRTQAMVAAFPNDPEIYAHFIAEHYPKLPEGFRETVTRLAPDNGWFDEIEASVLAKSFIREERIPLSDVKPPHPETGPKKRRRIARKTREVIDYEILGQIIDLLHQAATKSENTDYTHQLAEQRIALLNDEGDYQSQNLKLIISIAYNGRTLARTPKVIKTWCAHLVEKGDTAEFEKLVRTIETLSRKHLQDTSNLLSFLIWRGALNHNLEIFAYTARDLQLPELEKKFRSQHESLSALIEKTKNDKSSDEFHKLTEHHAPFYLRFASSYGRSPAVLKIITKESLLPGTKSESSHIAWRWLLQFFVILTLLSLFTLAFSYYYRSHLRDQIPSRLYLRSILLGSIIPIGAFMVLRHGTPLGNLDRGPG